MSLDEIAFVRGVGTAERTGRLRPNESVAGLLRIKEGQALNFSLAVAQRYWRSWQSHYCEKKSLICRSLEWCRRRYFTVMWPKASLVWMLARGIASSFDRGLGRFQDLLSIAAASQFSASRWFHNRVGSSSANGTRHAMGGNGCGRWALGFRSRRRTVSTASHPAPNDRIKDDAFILGVVACPREFWQEYPNKIRIIALASTTCFFCFTGGGGRFGIDIGYLTWAVLARAPLAEVPASLFRK